jgi:hypothetical protein
MINLIVSLITLSALSYLGWVAYTIRRCARWHRQAIQRKVSYK